MQVQLKVANGSKAGQTIAVNRPRFLIGRAEDCHLKPKSDLISRYHCAILSEDGFVAARDLGSKNGVFLNGNRIAIEEEIKNGDHLVIGPLDFEVILSVTLSAEKKPKVESIADVVARTVERDTMATVEASAGDESTESLADWLMEDDDGATLPETEGTKVIKLKQVGVKPDDEKEVDEFLNIKKGEGKRGDTTKTRTHQQIVNPEPPPPSTATAPAGDPEAAPNLLKNFFQGR